MEAQAADIPYSYTTVLVTKSRIEKGLLAVPASLFHLFPASSGSIKVLDDVGQWETKTFTAFGSTSRECRIGGMTDFYRRYDIKSGDEIVIQAYGGAKYGLIPERMFRGGVIRAEEELDRAKSESDAEMAVSRLSQVTNQAAGDVAGSEFLRLAERASSPRNVRTRDTVTSRENVPASLRAILTRLYAGRCQVSGFSFLKQDGAPYFELHHIFPTVGNHVKNVLVVSANVHAQFTYAKVEHVFDRSGWLRNVSFNGDCHAVHQVVDTLPAKHEKEIHAE